MKRKIGHGTLLDVRWRRHGDGFLVKFDDDEDFHDDAGNDDPTLISKLGAFRIVKKLQRKTGTGKDHLVKKELRKEGREKGRNEREKRKR